MSNLWTPNYRGPFPNPQTERQEIFQQLWVLKVVIPGAEKMETAEIRDYLIWQIEREKERRKNPRPQLTMPVDEAKELIAWRRRKGLDRSGQPIK